MDPREQVLARGRHAGEHRLHQVHQCRAGAILRLRSLRSRCSLRHWRLLGPRRWGPFVLVDAILTPTREPSLLSSQVQHGPGHPPLFSPPSLTVTRVTDNVSELPPGPVPVPSGLWRVSTSSWSTGQK